MMQWILFLWYQQHEQPTGIATIADQASTGLFIICLHKIKTVKKKKTQRQLKQNSSISVDAVQFKTVIQKIRKSSGWFILIRWTRPFFPQKNPDWIPFGPSNQPCSAGFTVSIYRQAGMSLPDKLVNTIRINHRFMLRVKTECYRHKEGEG